MRELYIGSRTAQADGGKQFGFDYYVLIGEVDTGVFFCESYGVKVAQTDAENQCAIPNITTSAARIDSLTQLLMGCCVTPGDLSDVVADWL